MWCNQLAGYWYPGYIAEERLSDLGCYYIDDQSSPTNMDRAIVYMDRSSESRDALMALNELNYAKGWDFEGAAYYQQRLITWLERRKAEIIEKVTATKQGEELSRYWSGALQSNILKRVSWVKRLIPVLPIQQSNLCSKISRRTIASRETPVSGTT